MCSRETNNGDRFRGLFDRLDSSSNTSKRGGRRNCRQAGQEERSRDDAVQATDQDALQSRISAGQKGYLTDTFAQALQESINVANKAPIINRGTYVRTRAIDELVVRFLETTRGAPLRQIISLGAGSDTRFFRLKQDHAHLTVNLCYHEIDFPKTTSTKIRGIEKNSSFLQLLTLPTESSLAANVPAIEIADDRASLFSKCYCIHGFDLRHMSDIAKPTWTDTVVPSAPTLILSECFLTYLEAKVSGSILDHLTENTFPSPSYLSIIQYEPIHPNDAFGRTMSANLAARGIAMPTLHALPDLQSHINRLTEKGFTHAQQTATIKHVWETWVSGEEKSRLRILELVDEEEEWMLLSAHYALLWAERGQETKFTTEDYTISGPGQRRLE